MKPAAFIAIGALILGAGAVAFVNHDSLLPPSARQSSASSGVYSSGGASAAQWIAAYYIERQDRVESGQQEGGLFEEERFVPPEYADRIAACVVEVFDRDPTNVAGRGQNIGENWRDIIPVVNDVRANNTGQYTAAQVRTAEQLDGAVFGVTHLCKEQIIPTATLQTSYSEWRNAPACREWRRQLDWYNEDPANRMLDAQTVAANLRGVCNQQAHLPDPATLRHLRQCGTYERNYQIEVQHNLSREAEQTLARARQNECAFVTGSSTPASSLTTPSQSISQDEVEAARQRGVAASDDAASAGGRMTREEVRARERTIRDGATCEAQSGVWNAFERRCYLPNRN